MSLEEPEVEGGGSQERPAGTPEPDYGRASTFRGLLALASLVVLVAGLRAAAELLVPLLLALFVALLSLPLLDWLRARGVGGRLALLLTVLADAAVLAGFILMLSAAVATFAGAAPGYLEELTIRARGGIDFLEEQGVTVSDWMTGERLDLAPLVDMAGGIVGGTVRGVTSFAGYTLVVLLAVVFMLGESLGLPTKLRRALGARDLAPRQLIEITREIQRYLALKTGICLLTGLLIGLWLVLLGVEFALFWALIAFLFNYVPMIGSIVASVPTVLVVWVQDGSPAALLVALAYLVVNFLVGNLLEPHLMGRSFGLSTLTVFLALAFWGWVWGPVGALLSVPLTMAIKIMLEHIEGLQWIAVLLGKREAAAGRG